MQPQSTACWAYTVTTAGPASGPGRPDERTRLRASSSHSLSSSRDTLSSLSSYSESLTALRFLPPFLEARTSSLSRLLSLSMASDRVKATSSTEQQYAAIASRPGTGPVAHWQCAAPLHETLQWPSRAHQ